ncbi:hypothetical protein TomMM35A_18200 [Sphingobium sp. TomMM35A]
MKHLSLAVVGVGFDNKTGPARRFEIEMCEPGEPVELRPEPKNPADRNAIAVYSARGIQIGYVRAERAPLIGTAMRRGVVEAIFQDSEQWGATIRVHLDGTTPTLPAKGSSYEEEEHSALADDQDWWPDEEWPE